ncbi:MAG: DUF488 domain-containing protein [Nitrososphaerales archaeon]
MSDAVNICTIGHSTRSMKEFLDLLESFGVKTLVDVRHFPGSKRNPQFNKDAMPLELSGSGINYRHIGDLGGLRQPKKDSINLAWRSKSFRAYADHMQTEEFEKGLDELIMLARQTQVSIMCAEAVPWRCHRFLLSDALVARGYDVEHILGKDKLMKHALSKFAKVQGLKITYPLENQTLQPDDVQRLSS